MKRVYTNNEFTGHYPVGTAAVVVSSSQEEAAGLLNALLKVHGLPGDAKIEDMREIGLKHPDARILCDGNY